VRARREAADRLYSEGRFDEAWAAYGRVLDDAPHSAAALEKLGRIALLRNATQEAERYLSAALERAPWYRRIWPFDVGLKYALG
jgi:tetratricopeptide (TPR) repeat protein